MKNALYSCLLLVCFAGLCFGESVSELESMAAKLKYDPERDGFPEVTKVQTQEARNESGFNEWKISFPSLIESPHESNNTAYGFLRVPAAGSDRVMIILPFHMANDFTLDNVFAGRYLSEGIAALLMPLPYQMDRAPEGHRSGELFTGNTIEISGDNFKQSLLDVGVATAYLKKEGFAHVGLSGVSLGGHVSAALFGIDDGYEVAVLFLVGGNIHHILYNDALKDEENTIEEEYTIEELGEVTRPWDPLTFAPLAKLRKENIMMVNATNDDRVLPENTRILHETLGEPEITWVPGGHETSAPFLFAPMMKVGRFAKAAFDRVRDTHSQDEDF
ncbi:MAG: alpha/beta hydrolase family protein [Planctomycetes bacterium]|nr:alpha/beta hydrolase family protein [Planctomycetota bacterium]